MSVILTWIGCIGSLSSALGDIISVFTTTCSSTLFLSKFFVLESCLLEGEAFLFKFNLTLVLLGDESLTSSVFLKELEED